MLYNILSEGSLLLYTEVQSNSYLYIFKTNEIGDKQQTNEVKKSKRTFEHKLAQNINHTVRVSMRM